ncbi:malonyl-ACP O-methyltransferase BioC [Serratia microhaemolytica]|uniref:malonyl-ACP O-methyltransferase BioC n=1 Tax=Serratia microhaemolytica TaxID=2675110 RepID=UPI000FDCDFC2|nr:malonyl-ACP O-methyltransferase BioC [Serratia microhaemolytica]
MSRRDNYSNKQSVAQAFSRAASHYDSAAQLQREVGERLLAFGSAHTGLSVLDAGCGTGYFSRRWRALGKQVIALDLAPGMLAYARQQQAANHYLQADLEHLPLSAEVIDICFSNLVVQWCHSLPQVLAELLRITRPGGLILFSTLAEGSLHQLAEAWQRVDGTSHINQFLPLSEIRTACQRYKHHLEVSWNTLNYPNVLTLMHGLKAIGATHLQQGRHRGLLSRQRLLALQAAYPKCDRQLPLSYHLVYGVIQRD